MAKAEKVDTSWEATKERLNKQYGKGTVIGMNEKLDGVYDTISTGSIDFDNALGIGGFARGKMYEMKGWEGTGKTTICGHLVAECQKKYPNDKVLYIDSEHALDLEYFSALGVNIDDLFINQPSFGEEGFNVALELIKTGQVALVIIDSDTMLKPEKEIKNPIGSSSLGLKARLNSQAIPIIKIAASDHNTCVVIISQFREKIGVMFGSPVTTSGGNAMRFICDVVMEVKKTLMKTGSGDTEVVSGNETTVKITKNKMGSPFKKARFDILFGEGIDKIGEIITLGNKFDIIRKHGSKITYDEQKYDVDTFRELLVNNEDFYKEIRQKIDKVYVPSAEEVAVAEDVEMEESETE